LQVSIRAKGQREGCISLAGSIGGPENFPTRNIRKGQISVRLWAQLCVVTWRDKNGRGSENVVFVGVEGVAFGIRWGLDVVYKNLVLGSIRITVVAVVGRCTMPWIVNVISLQIFPIQGLQGFRTHVGNISPFGLRRAGGISVTAHGRDGFADHSFRWVFYVALEGGHVHLVRTASRIVNPEPRAYAFSIRARRQSRNFEGLELACDAVVHHGEDDEVRRLYRGYVGFIGNSEGAACHISMRGGMNIGRTSTHVIRPRIRNVAGGRPGLAPQTTAHGGEGLVACDLEIYRPTGRKLGDGIVRGRVVEGPWTMHPPTRKGEILQWLHSPIGVDVVGLTSPHGRYINGHVGKCAQGQPQN